MSDSLYYFSCSLCACDFYVSSEQMIQHSKLEGHEIVVLWVYPTPIPKVHRAIIGGALGACGLLIIFLSILLWVFHR